MNYNYLKENGLILYEVISGSRSYGTANENSDLDIRYVYIQPLDDILSGDYKKQVNDQKNDIIGYEISRFLELLSNANPNILELLWVDDEFIISKNPLFDIILESRDIFLTKKCKMTFAGYAKSQIKSLDNKSKKHNWENRKMAKKTIFDFIFFIEEGKKISWNSWNKRRGIEKFIGLSNISRDLYAVYFDYVAWSCFSPFLLDSIKECNKYALNNAGLKTGLGYKGILKLDETGGVKSNQLRLSKIPKGETPIGYITYNPDDYTKYCIEYAQYVEWLNNRNKSRWVVSIEGNEIDGKNILHLVRLVRMAIEIANGMGLIVKRPDAQELLNIKMGNFYLQDLLENVNRDLENIDNLFNQSNLPEDVDLNVVKNMLLSIRKKFFNLG